MSDAMLFLHIYEDEQKIREVELKDKSISVGRSQECDLVLSDISVSRVHAHIEPHGNFFLLRDKESTNGTFVNERAVQVEVLRQGDAIRVGKFILKVEPSRKKRGDTSKIRIESLPSKALEKLEHAFQGLPGEPGSLAGANVEAGHALLLRVYEIHQELGYVDSLPSLLDNSLNRMMDELDADHGCILLVDFQTNDEVREAADLVPSSIASRSTEVGEEAEMFVPEEMVASIIESKSAITLTSPEDGGKALEIGAPFLAQDRLLGMVYLGRSEGRESFQDHDLQFLTLVASFVAVNLTNTLLFDEIFAEKEKLQAVITGLSDGVLLADADYRVFEASAKASVLLGQEETLIGKSLAQLTPNYKYSMDWKLIENEVRQGGCDFEIESGEEESHSLKVRILPFVGKVTGIAGRIVFLTDSTENKRIEEKKIEFIRNIAHKIRTPLTLIEGNLPLLHGSIPEDSQDAEILRDVEKGSRNLCQIVDDFASYLETEVRSLRSLASTQEVNLHELSYQVIEELKEQASAKRVLINNRLTSNLPCLVLNSRRWKRALKNLIQNAIKFSPNDGMVILEGEPSGDVLELRIIDEGPGIPASDKEAVFKLLHQVDEAGTGEAPGLGLGLAVAREIVQEHRGDIQITSPYRFPDHGCCVTILLPIPELRAEPEPDPIKVGEAE